MEGQTWAAVADAVGQVEELIVGVQQRGAICASGNCEARAVLREEDHLASGESGMCLGVGVEHLVERRWHQGGWTTWTAMSRKGSTPTGIAAAAAGQTEAVGPVAAVGERGDELTWVNCEGGKAIPHCISKRRVLAEFETIYPLTSSSHPHVPRPHTLPSSASSSRMQDRRNVH